MLQIKAIGTAVAHAGTIQHGRWEVLRHPTGTTEFIPVIIAQGKEEGPCLWLTAGIHGSEHAGPLVIYKLLTQTLLQNMRGAIIAIPALNPAGLRTMKREPYHSPADPNRMWPDGKPKTAHDPYKDPPSALEVAYQQLFDEIIGSVDCMIDFHNAWTGSLSFAYRDRVLYSADGDSEANKSEAESLSARQFEMLKAYGHTIVSERPAEKVIDADLHRSTSAAVLYLGRVPAFTAELGTGHMPDPAILRAALAGTRNVMRWAGMLEGEIEPIEGIRVIQTDEPMCQCPTPRVEYEAVVHHLAQPGDFVHAGDPVAETFDIWGQSNGLGLLRSVYDGFIIARSHGIYYYPGDEIYSMAIRDTHPLVCPYPDDYFKTR